MSLPLQMFEGVAWEKKDTSVDLTKVRPVWEWQDGHGVWNPYSDETIAELEQSFNSGKTLIPIESGGRKYVCGGRLQVVSVAVLTFSFCFSGTNWTWWVCDKPTSRHGARESFDGAWQRAPTGPAGDAHITTATGTQCAKCARPGEGLRGDTNRVEVWV